MKNTIGKLRKLIRESLAGFCPDETYEDLLLDDPNFNTPSVYVSADAKTKNI